MYSNLRGCDGERVYYQGASLIGINGNIVTRGDGFSLQDVVGFSQLSSRCSLAIFDNCNCRRWIILTCFVSWNKRDLREIHTLNLYKQPHLGIAVEL